MKASHCAFTLTLCLTACEPPIPSQCQEEGRFDLVFAGEGFGARGGAMVPFRLARAEDGFVEASGAAIIGEDGAFEERISCGLEAGVAHVLHWYVRSDLGGECADASKAWAESLSPPNEDVEVLAAPDLPPDPDGCAPF